MVADNGGVIAVDEDHVCDGVQFLLTLLPLFASLLALECGNELGFGFGLALTEEQVGQVIDCALEKFDTGAAAPVRGRALAENNISWEFVLVVVVSSRTIFDLVVSLALLFANRFV